MAGMTLKQIHDRGDMTHMPFLAPRQQKRRVLFFCKADRPKIWKLHYEDERGVHRVNTGLPDDTVECSPTAWLDDTGWHISFIGGNTPANRRYYLYRMDGMTLDSLAQATVVIKTGAGFVHNERLVYTREGTVFIDDGQNKIRTINFQNHRIYRVSYRPDEMETLIITAHDVQKNKIYVIEHDLVTNNENIIACDGKAAYKCAILGTEIIYADKFGPGFEQRRIKTGKSIERQFTRQFVPDKIDRKPNADPIGKVRFEICRACNKSKEYGYACDVYKGDCFDCWRVKSENKCPEGKW
jgi:hypothetical protein